ncbi:MAG: hypothetical protein H0X01_09840, partial [Nitrospira sp.]|nr:hypothetical protein [Nitrospira sp.]
MLELDLTNLLSQPQADSGTLNSRRKQAHESFESFRAQGASTFFELVEPAGRPYIEEILKAAQELRVELRPRNFLNLGIGGSALGGEAVLRAMLHPLQNDLPASSVWMNRFYFPDNIDPDTNAAVLQVLDPAETLVHIASKSGSTAETAAQ